METNGIVMIGVEHIHPHPNNPRLDVGDVTELADSLRKNGVMQNLTVVPMEDKPGEYMTLIGHRRVAAAQLAGIGELPCKIREGLELREQVSIMMEENMQRDDLTIYEQAQGFQMMLDLGETEATIAEKTGFSKATVRHRLNIAKLDPESLKEKDQDESFQLTLKDLYELEKVKDIEARNKILKEARNSEDLVWKAQRAAGDEKRKKNLGVYAMVLKKSGVEKAPEKAESEQYSNKWTTVKEYDLEADLPEDLDLPEDTAGLYYLEWYRRLRVIKKAPKEKKVLSEYEIKQKEISKKREQLGTILKESSARRKEFIQNIVSGKINPVKDEEKMKNLAWRCMVELEVSMYKTRLRSFFLKKDYYQSTQEEKDEADEKAAALSIPQQMLIFLDYALRDSDPVGYNLDYRESVGEKMQKAYTVFEMYGWSFESAEEKAVIDGTHEFYIKPEVQE